MCPGGARLTAVTLLCIVALSSLPPVGPAAALGAAAYDSLEVGGRYVVNANKNEFHEFWDPGQGAGLFFATSFHLGRVWFGARYLLNSGTTPDYPDFQSTFVYAGWSYPLFPMRRLRLDPGFLLGVDSFFFEDEQNTGLENETEAAGEVFLRTGYGFPAGWRLNLTVSSHVIFTSRRINLFYVSAGLSRSCSTPGWLRSFLK